MAGEVMSGLCEQLAAETTCPLCLDLLAQPVLTACGHSFCQRCLAAVLGAPPRPAACPQCRATVEPGSLRPNHSLGNVAELARALEEAARPRCPAHGEPLALFCDSCFVPICKLCRNGSEHSQHRVRTAEVAARELRESLQINLLTLQKTKEKLKLEEDQKTFDLMSMVMLELQRVPKIFEELQQFLKEREKILLTQLNHMSKELVMKWDEYNSKVLERESLLDAVIAEIEEKQDQPLVEFLTDIEELLSSCEDAKVPIPEAISLELQRNVASISETIQLVMDMVARFKVDLQDKTDGEREKVTLDPETAGPLVALSQDYKTVRIGDGDQNLPDISKRFMYTTTVLGSQGFTSGRHFWEVEVEKENAWAVGVALESVPRKEQNVITTCKKVWALRLDWDGWYRTDRDLLTVTEELQRIRVHLDYEAGLVTFYNTENMRQIVQLEATFTEKVFPYFSLLSDETQIRLCD